MDIANKYYEKHKKEIQDYTKKNLELDKCHEGDETKFTIECSDCTDTPGLGTGIVGTPEQLEKFVNNRVCISSSSKKVLEENNPASWKIGDKFIYKVPFDEKDNPRYKDWDGAEIEIFDIKQCLHPETLDLTTLFFIKDIHTGEPRKLSGIDFQRLKKIGETEEITKID